MTAPAAIRTNTLRLRNCPHAIDLTLRYHGPAEIDVPYPREHPEVTYVAAVSYDSDGRPYRAKVIDQRKAEWVQGDRGLALRRSGGKGWWMVKHGQQDAPVGQE